MNLPSFSVLWLVATIVTIPMVIWDAEFTITNHYGTPLTPKQRFQGWVIILFIAIVGAIIWPWSWFSIGRRILRGKHEHSPDCKRSKASNLNPHALARQDNVSGCGLTYKAAPPAPRSPKSIRPEP